MSANAASTVCMALLVISFHSAWASENCDGYTSVRMANTEVFPNGSVWDHLGRVLYPPDAVRKEDDVLYVCPCKLPDRPCLRKCCAKDQAMNFNSLNCEPHVAGDGWFRPNLTVDEEGTTQVLDEGQFTVFYGNYCFGFLLEPTIYKEDAHYFHLGNGSLLLPGRSGSFLGPQDFCIEYFPEVDTYLPYVCFSGSQVSGYDDPCHHIRYILYPIGMIISIFFLLASLVVYAAEPKLRNLSGKCLIFYMTSLLCSFVCLSFLQVGGGSLSDKACLVVGFIMYFTMLCTFLWLNVLCVDITLAFRPTQSISGNPVQRDRKKLLFYSLYAWGLPVLLTIIAIIAEFHPHTNGTILQPKFRQTCWFHEESTKLIYFIVPVAIILSVNLCLFVYTALNIYSINKKNEMCTDKKDKRRCAKGDKKRLRTVVKLYVVMGITWIMEILSFVIGGHKCIWLFPDMVNTLQGLLIFIILICNRKVIGLLRKRFCRKPAAANDPRLDESDAGTDDEMETSTESADGKSMPGNSMRMKSKAVKANGTNSGSSPATLGGYLYATAN